MIQYYLIASNPFVDAYIQSDILGKFIFAGLITLSISSWIVIINKWILNYRARKNSLTFQGLFQSLQMTPLAIDCDYKENMINPFRTLYAVLKKNTLELLNKNKHFSRKGNEGASFLHRLILILWRDIFHRLLIQRENFWRKIYLFWPRS